MAEIRSGSVKMKEIHNPGYIATKNLGPPAMNLKSPGKS